jgi:hypothetical protein
MDTQKFEELAKRWPDLFQKAKIDYLGCGDGWYGIMDALCEELSQDVEQCRMRLNYASDKDTGNQDRAAKEQEQLLKYLDELPTLMQVKEKFGRLRVFVQDGNESTWAAISFAEKMSGRVCEMCGAPGEPRNDGWVKTLCDTHHRQREATNIIGRKVTGK